MKRNPKGKTMQYSRKNVSQVILATSFSLWGLSCASPSPTGSEGPTLSAQEALKQAIQAPLAGQNQAPIIQGLSANPTAKVGSNDPISFTLQAHDPDGDKLNYYWRSDHGHLTQENGLNAYWRAEQNTEPRIASIDVVVSDGKGGQTQGNVKVFVDANGQAQVKYIAKQNCAEGADRYEELFNQ